LSLLLVVSAELDYFCGQKHGLMNNGSMIDSIDMMRMLELNEVMDGQSVSVIYENSCVVSTDYRHVDRQTGIPLLSRPTRMNIFVFMLCLEGDCVVQCDMQRCHIVDGTLFTCKPGSILQVEEGHIDRLSVLIVDVALLRLLNLHVQKLLPHYDALQKISLMGLSPEEAGHINQEMKHVAHAISRPVDHLYYHELVHAHITTFIYECISLFSFENDRHDNVSPGFSHARVYMDRFINLVGLHFREERKIGFYAEKLHISPKYLGSLVVQLTGRTASQWIAGYVIAEAKALLMNTSMSVQQISLELHFPNQSFFGKYFKSHMGISPGEFRSRGLK
jgi:AraC-like DNA-binding protein